MDKQPEQDPRVYFAAERTFLAWIRTGLGLMGGGFAVARFGLFLRQLHGVAPQAGSHNGDLSEWSGVVLVALGVLVNLGAVASHLQLVRELRSGTWVAGRVSRGALLLSIVLALLGIALAIYLVVGY